MEKKEAIEIVRKLYNDSLFLKKDKEAMVTLIPELAESEDERIRKWIIGVLSIYEHDRDLRNAAIAWLEEQAEYANFRNKIQIGDKVTRNRDGVLVNLSQLNRVAKKDEKQGEQKYILKYKIGDYVKNTNYKGEPIYEIVYMDKECYICEYRGNERMGDKAVMHFSFDNPYLRLVQKPADKVEQKGMNIVEEDMTPFQKKVFCIIDTAIEEEQGLKQVCDELLMLAHDEIIQKPAWSEEDTTHYNRILKELNLQKEMPINVSVIEEVKSDIIWLKSLKDKVLSQPRQEWSEEDVYALNTLSAMVANSCLLAKEEIFKLLDWLNSIKSRLYLQEWSEADKRKINRIHSILRQAADTHAFSTSCRLIGDKECIELQDFLKSLRPQNTWKPSEEQLGVIEAVINNRSFQRRHLDSLYEQLKKLK